eukprot:TRINITY_DN11715_c0_g1_i1.p1 TRINITY_DN11715_c0_g1~~TRINITY_DN11715_c0_g1_i1.p1  ORF type:complete len:105 (-),score=15.78 TRINITY_DN11715_c0_g1_i1:37-351(-)
MEGVELTEFNENLDQYIAGSEVMTTSLEFHIKKWGKKGERERERESSMPKIINLSRKRSRTLNFNFNLAFIKAGTLREELKSPILNLETLMTLNRNLFTEQSQS